MKILHLPLNVTGSEQYGQARGMREVFDEVVEFDYLNVNNPNEKLLEVAKQGFDLCWMQLQETNLITPETLKAVRPYIKVMTQWMGDIREVVPEYQQKIGKLFDITYLGFDHRKMYQPHCNDVKLMMIAVDPDEVTSHIMQEPSHDVVFIGNHYGNQFPESDFRLEMVKLLKNKYKALVLGTGWPEGLSDGVCAVKDQGLNYSKGKICISVNHFNDIKYYSERLLWCLASGRPTIAKRTPDLEFKEHDHYLGFDDLNEMTRMIDYALETDLLQMANNARNEVTTKHNWEERLKCLKELRF